MAYCHAASIRLAYERPYKAITLPQDETFTGGLGLAGIEPVSYSIVLEQVAPARDHDTWHTLMEPALAGLNCRVMPSTSEAAPELLAYVDPHPRAHHSPDLFPGQHELSQAVSVPLATKQRTAAKAVAKAAETLKQAHEYLALATNAPAHHGPGRPPKGVACLGQVKDALEGARDARQRLSAQRAQVTQCIRAIGCAYHCVDLSGQTYGGLPALQLQGGRTQRIPLAAKPSLARTRLPQKARLPHSGA